MCVSTTLGGLASQDNNDVQYVLPLLLPTLKTDAARVRDTKVLASALGLASSTLLSPPTTVYPDDSIMLAGKRRKLRLLSQVCSCPQSQLLSPNTEASVRLDNLVLANFSSMMSLPSMRTVLHDGHRHERRAGQSHEEAHGRQAPACALTAIAALPSTDGAVECKPGRVCGLAVDNNDKKIGFAAEDEGSPSAHSRLDNDENCRMKQL